MVSPILDAAGVLHSDPQLVLLPDDPALGEFRADFAGLLGTIEERQTDNGPGFAGADKIVSTYELFDRLEKHQDERSDARAFLGARLVDLFLGDWDRHAGSVALGAARRLRQRRPGPRFRATGTRPSHATTGCCSASRACRCRSSSRSGPTIPARSGSPGTPAWWIADC